MPRSLLLHRIYEDIWGSHRIRYGQRRLLSLCCLLFSLCRMLGTRHWKPALYITCREMHHPLSMSINTSRRSSALHSYSVPLVVLSEGSNSHGSNDISGSPPQMVDPSTVIRRVFQRGDLIILQLTEVQIRKHAQLLKNSMKIMPESPCGLLSSTPPGTQRIRFTAPDYVPPPNPSQPR